MPRNDALRRRAEKVLAKIAETDHKKRFEAKKEAVRDNRNPAQKRDAKKKAEWLIEKNGIEAATFAVEQMFLKSDSEDDKEFWKNVKEKLAEIE